VIEENGERGHAAPTPNELGKGQEEEEDYKISVSRYLPKLMAIEQK
jgi:hypothetical protein